MTSSSLSAVPSRVHSESWLRGQRHVLADAATMVRERDLATERVYEEIAKENRMRRKSESSSTAGLRSSAERSRLAP